MEMRRIPSTDVDVSIICLGSMNWGTFNSESEAHEQIDYAVSEGVNFIDTAEIYPIPPDKQKQGLTETYIGTWLKKRGTRSDLVIASKVSSRNQAASIRTRDASGGLTKKNILEAIDGTLARLQTDYVDLYQVHVPDRKTNYFGRRWYEERMDDGGASIEETLDGLSEVVRAGKARMIGISNETAWGLTEYIRIAREKNMPKIVTVQNQYSLLNRQFEVGMSEICLNAGVGLLAYSPLSKGSLTGKYLGGVIPPGSRFDYSKRDIERYNGPLVQESIRKFTALAEAHGMQPAELAIAWVNTRPFITATIIGTRSMEQVKTDVGAARITLSQDVLDEIKKIHAAHPDPHA